MPMTEFTPIDYLKIDIANNFGLDKLDWQERISWFNDLNNPSDPGYLDMYLKEAESPALFFAGVQAYRDALKGVPSGYGISLDACSSGLQLLACLIGCEASGALCGLVNTGHREDAYTNIYNSRCSSLDQSAKITRTDTKQAIN